MNRGLLTLIILIALFPAPDQAHADTELAGGQGAAHHVIVCGSGGEDKYREKFWEWGNRLSNALIHRLDIPESHVHLLAEAVGDAQTLNEGIEQASGQRPADLESIRILFASLADTVNPEDDLYVYLIGHGSYLKYQSKFHIPGPDLTAEALDALLLDIPARRIVVLNATSASAGFINTLSAPNRVICTATKSIDEVNATDFMEHFVRGLEEGAAGGRGGEWTADQAGGQWPADRNHDNRISFLEACEYAADLTSAWYLGEGLIATEHAILDDNADGLGSRLPIDGYSEELFQLAKSEDGPSPDGALAERCFLKELSFAPSVSPALIGAYLGALDEISVLKREKMDMELPDYYARLEQLLLKAARANREIHRLTPAPVDESIDEGSGDDT